MNNIQYVGGAINPGDCIGGAWNLVTRRFWLYIGLGLVTMLLISCVPLVNFFLLGPVLGGFYYLVLRDMRDEPVEFGMLFKGFEKFIPLMVVGLIQSIPSIVVTIFQYTIDIARLPAGSAPGDGDVNFLQSGPDVAFAGIPVIILIVVAVVAFFFSIAWHLAFAFAIPLVVDQDADIGTALLTSAKAAMSNVGGLIVLIILEGLVMILGVIAICLGVLVAIPVIYAANAFAYTQVFPYFVRPDLNVTPPPPSAYGGTYGTNY